MNEISELKQQDENTPKPLSHLFINVLQIMTSQNQNTAQSQHDLLALRSRVVGVKTSYKYIFGGSAAVCMLIGGLLGAVSNQSSPQRQISLPTSKEEVLSQETPSQVNSSLNSNEPEDAQEVRFTGIDLPITNTLCTKKGNFCIYGLANLVNSENGTANYRFSDVANGEQVNITGTIRIENIERNSEGNRTFYFGFEDDQSNTTPGWAAAGGFTLAQDPDPKKSGILTRFKTVRSYGPKTPVGLENTSYLFPQ